MFNSIRTPNILVFYHCNKYYNILRLFIVLNEGLDQVIFSSNTIRDNSFDKSEFISKFEVQN